MGDKIIISRIVYLISRKSQCDKVTFLQESYGIATKNPAEKEKKRIAEQLGIIVYDLHQNGEVLPEAVLAFCDQITEINNQIATLRQKLTAMEMPKETPTSAPAAGGFCPNCGSPVREGAKFCGKCGNAM